MFDPFLVFFFFGGRGESGCSDDLDLVLERAGGDFAKVG